MKVPTTRAKSLACRTSILALYDHKRIKTRTPQCNENLNVKELEVDLPSIWKESIGSKVGWHIGRAGLT